MAWPRDPFAFELHEPIGHNVVGHPCVYRATVAATQEVVAIKVMDLEVLLSNPPQLSKVLNAIKWGRQLKHPNILGVHTAFVVSSLQRHREPLWSFDDPGTAAEGGESGSGSADDDDNEPLAPSPLTTIAESATPVRITRTNQAAASQSPSPVRPVAHHAGSPPASPSVSTSTASPRSSAPSSPVRPVVRVPATDAPAEPSTPSLPSPPSSLSSSTAETAESAEFPAEHIVSSLSENSDDSPTPQLWIVMPYMSRGSVGDILATAHPDGLDELVMLHIVREVTKAVEFLHQFDLVHRAIRAASVFIHADNSVRLGSFDFCISMWKDDQRLPRLHAYEQAPDMAPWAAPEYLRQDLEGYDERADIYSLGVLAAELAHGRQPFDGLDKGKILIFKVVGYAPQLPVSSVSRVPFSRQAHQFVERSTFVEPYQRPWATKLLAASAFKQVRRTPQAFHKLLKALAPLEDRAALLGAARQAVSAMPPLTSNDVQLHDPSLFRHAFPSMEVGGLNVMSALGRDSDLFPGGRQSTPSPGPHGLTGGQGGSDLDQVIARLSHEHCFSASGSRETLPVRRMSENTPTLGAPRSRHRRNRSHGGAPITVRLRKRSNSEPAEVDVEAAAMAAASYQQDKADQQRAKALYVFPTLGSDDGSSSLGSSPQKSEDFGSALACMQGQETARSAGTGPGHGSDPDNTDDGDTSGVVGVDGAGRDASGPAAGTPSLVSPAGSVIFVGSAAPSAAASRTPSALPSSVVSAVPSAAASAVPSAAPSKHTSPSKHMSPERKMLQDSSSESDPPSSPSSSIVRAGTCDAESTSSLDESNDGDHDELLGSLVEELEEAGKGGAGGGRDDDDDNGDGEGDRGSSSSFVGLERVDSEKYYRVQGVLGSDQRRLMAARSAYQRQRQDSDVVSNLPQISPLLKQLPNPHRKVTPPTARRTKPASGTEVGGETET
eukprot:m.488373 g.488373  ORF g.488373 m.488373 type:complete len:947 (+) comp25745_c0_seq1:394-3234(+)